MQLNFSLPANLSERLIAFWQKVRLERVIVLLSVVVAFIATALSYKHGYIVAYGDAESHLNIAKRVLDSLTPGFAQLGGIWLPLPHLLMIPFVSVDHLWRSGLAGSIVSGVSFIISALFLYKLMFLLTKHRLSSFVASLVFIANPNILYLQTTPMTELVLIVFFILSTYYFIKFIEKQEDILSLILAAFFGFCAALSRYDGWFLVLFEAGVIALMYLPWKRIPKSIKEIFTGFDKERWQVLEGRLILFALLAFFAIGIWLAWDWLILGDPLYFTHSGYSAKSQQSAWLARGELPGYKNIFLSFWYYFVTSMSNAGVLVFFASLVGFIGYLVKDKDKKRWFVALILVVPFIFNVITMYLGQSVIFIPHITPPSFEWNLFNVRYGVMMVPMAAFCFAYLFYRARTQGRLLLAALFVAQIGLYLIGYSKVISLDDGVHGLSSAISKLPDAQFWIAKNYDDGLVLVDDFARTVSVVRTKIPMENIIYVGNKPYWEESLVAPEKYATWIIMQQNDEVWKRINDDPITQGRMYKYFNKVYTSPEILIFKRNPEVPAGS
jgi:hypothetical protein